MMQDGDFSDRQRRECLEGLVFRIDSVMDIYPLQGYFKRIVGQCSAAPLLFPAEANTDVKIMKRQLETRLESFLLMQWRAAMVSEGVH